ncbi:MAG: alanine racemase [Verrucomicrobiales bacterium]
MNSNRSPGVTLTQEARVWLEIDSSALRHNLERLKSQAGAAKLMAVVKADAYGHGVEWVIPPITDAIDWWGVANLQEAGLVRQVDKIPHKPCLLLGPVLPSEMPDAILQGCSGAISSLEEAQAWAQAARQTKQAARVHLAIDTGMGRMGVLERGAHNLVQFIQKAGLILEGVATHLPSADEDPDFTRQQLSAFESLLSQLPLPKQVLIHTQNSAGLLGYPAHSENLIRLGLALYGCSPLASSFTLQPVMRWMSRLTLIRDLPAGRTISYGRSYTTPHAMRVGTVCVGYADGYPRSLAHQNTVLGVRGQACSLLGRVTMDQVVIDLSTVPNAEVGDPVVLMGQSGSVKIDAAQLAEKAQTIPWEIMTGARGMRTQRTPSSLSAPA